MKTTSLPGIGHFKDSSFELADLLLWSIAETSVTIIAASIPFFRALVKHVSTGGHSGARRQSYRLESYRASHRSGTINHRPTADDNSDMSILEDPLPIQGIIKGSEVRVEYSLK